MTRLQKLQVEQSELRSKIGAALDTSEDKRGETWQTDLDKMTKRAQTMEIELRAALVSEETGEEKTEDLELRSIMEDASLGNCDDLYWPSGFGSDPVRELAQMPFR